MVGEMTTLLFVLRSMVMLCCGIFRWLRRVCRVWEIGFGERWESSLILILPNLKYSFHFSN